MKKLIFLISLCLLSQNYTIGAEYAQSTQQQTYSDFLSFNSAISQAIDKTCNSELNINNSENNNTADAVSAINNAAKIIQTPVIKPAPIPQAKNNVPMPAQNSAAAKKAAANSNISAQKSNTKIAQNTPPTVSASKPLSQAAPIPAKSQTPPQNKKSATAQKTASKPAAAPIPAKQNTISETQNKKTQPLKKDAKELQKQTAKIAAAPVPAIQQKEPVQQIPSDKLQNKQVSNQQQPAKANLQGDQNANTAVNKKVIQHKTAGLPPIPKSGEKLKQEYREEIADQQKYKFYEDEKLQNAINPQQKEEKKLNMWAEYKNKKSGKPPVIVEDNLSDPNDNTAVRATITKVEFTPSRVFTEEELQKLAAPLLSQPVTLDDIKKVVDGITRCYLLGDYATSKAYLPPQDLSDGVLKINLFEGTVGKVTVKDNRWTKTGYIKNRVAPKPGDLFKVSELEEDVIKFNNNNTVKLKVGLSAGEEQGETDITLNTEDPFPFHIAFLVDNQGRQTIGTTRWGGMITADSLFGHRDKMSLGGYLGSGNRVGFADYNFPLNKYGTRLGASVSAGNISVVNGPLRPFGIGGTSQVYSVYLTHPLMDKIDFNLSSYSAASIKRSTTDISGVKLPTLGTFSLTQGFTARKDTERGIWYTGHYGSVGFEALGGDEDFFKYEGNIMRLHDFGHGIIGQFRVAGQYSPQDRLPWMEQFQIGGMSTVRGYSEGLLLGKSGYLASAEIITPLPFLPKAIGSDRLGYIYPREMIKGAVFMDHGMVFPYKGGQAVDSGEFLMSWGLGLRVNLKKDVAARFYWGFGLNNKYDVDQKLGRFHFDITCAPDIGRVVAGRHPKNKKKKENL